MYQQILFKLLNKTCALITIVISRHRKPNMNRVFLLFPRQNTKQKIKLSVIGLLTKILFLGIEFTFGVIFNRIKQ